MISQITPAGVRPARRARSTAASVWPARTSTPPSRGHQREDVAGRDDVARRRLVGSIATAMVRARSAAEMPVVTPSRASIETVKAVPWRGAVALRHQRQAELLDAARAVSARQIRPRACLAMKLIASGVAHLRPG